MASVSEPAHSTFTTLSDTTDTVGAAAKVHKPSPISYFSSGFRDSREKNSKTQKPLVIVIPPAILLHQHGPLGHTLSSGSPLRLAQGIVMTLHPTMYAQLTAISREFNFPSTVGLCLYFRHTENGVTLTPRISDESWSSLWQPAFGCQSSATPAVSITGIIEFDIDLRQAKWYSSWLSFSSRDTFDFHHSVHPYTVASERNGDSKTFVNDEQLDDRRDTYLHYPSSSASLRRHPPKKLSLVDKFDFPNARLSSSPLLEKVPLTTHALSPIAQETEPRSVRNNIKSRVQSWRAGAALELALTPLVATGQVSPDPANIPNTMQIDVLLKVADVLSLEEYNSVCPAEPEGLGPLNLNETDCVLSPNIAQRAIESSSLTTTSGGPPLSSPSTHRCKSHAASVDIGDSHVFSPPLNATTATSWGPLLSDPPSPLVVSMPATPVIGYRVIDGTVAPEAWRRSWPCYSSQTDINSLGSPRSSLDSQFRYPHTLNQYPAFNLYPPLYPFFDIYPAVLKIAPTSRHESSIVPCCARPNPISSSGLMSADTDPLVYPIIDPEVYHLQLTETLRTQAPSVYTMRYPTLDLYPAVYPHINLYPTIMQTNCPVLPTLKTEVPLASMFSICNYPTLVIYPPVYPHFDLYPPHLQDFQNSALNVSLKSRYPTNKIYPAVDFDLYTTVHPLKEISTAPASTVTYPIAQAIENVNDESKAEYPSILLHTPLYPHFDIYPTLNGRPVDLPSASTLANSDAYAQAMMDVRLQLTYPTIILYPTLYPHVEPYPMHLYNEKSLDLTFSNSAFSCTQSTETVNVRLQPGYPILALYPALYPYFDIYPTIPLIDMPDMLTTATTSVHWDAQVGGTMDLQLESGYPIINPYPDPTALLPDRCFPSIVAAAASEGCPEVGIPSIADLRLKPGYPTIVIYPAVYPHFEIYPGMPPLSTLSTTTQYPSFDLYPIVNKYTCTLATSANGSNEYRQNAGELGHCDFHDNTLS